jgi:hypothetical protein
MTVGFIRGAVLFTGEIPFAAGRVVLFSVFFFFIAIQTTFASQQVMHKPLFLV